MKKMFALLSLVLSFAASADSFSYRMFEDSVDEFTPFVVVLELSGKFDKSSTVKSLTIKDDKQVLFSFDQKTVNKVLKFAWKGQTLSITEGSEVFKAKVKKEVMNGWGDTSIKPGDIYSFYVDGEILLTPNGTTNDVRLDISNETVEEACLWGILKK